MKQLTNDNREKTDKVIGKDVVDRWNKDIVDAVKSGAIDIPETNETDPALGSVGSGTKLDPASLGACPGSK